MTSKYFLIIATLCLSPLLAHAEVASTCYGTTAEGRLEHGVQLPYSGENFIGYSRLGDWSGRTYVHSTVKAIVLEAYQTLSQSQPSKVFKYAETGFKEGGEFKPHKTHQNGLSVDFMVPVMHEQDGSTHLPTHPLNKFGYDIEFDNLGHFQQYTIDYHAMAAHIVALHQASEKLGVKIWRVIFAPELQPFLLQTEFGNYLKQHIQFSTQRSWVRHDEHYHVDFIIPCEAL